MQHSLNFEIHVLLCKQKHLSSHRIQEKQILVYVKSGVSKILFKAMSCGFRFCVNCVVFFSMKLHLAKKNTTLKSIMTSLLI